MQNNPISFYSKYGEAELARWAFERMEDDGFLERSSALLVVYTRAGRWAECLEFSAMVREGWRPDKSSMVSALSSCTHLGAYGVDRSVHCALLRSTMRLNTFMQMNMLSHITTVV